MGKKKEGNTGQEPFRKVLVSGERYLIQDKEHGSNAFVPVQIEEGYCAEVAWLDQGILTELRQGEHVCDNLVFSKSCQVQGLKITWMIELKGTKNEKEAKHSLDQISETIDRLNRSVQLPETAKYLENRDYVFAAIVGAPDKTLPALNNKDLKTLCQKLYRLSAKRGTVKDMLMLFCYIRPDKNCKRARKCGLKSPYDIWCYSNKEGYIPYPSMLLELLK